MNCKKNEKIFKKAVAFSQMAYSVGKSPSTNSKNSKEISYVGCLYCVDGYRADRDDYLF